MEHLVSTILAWVAQYGFIAILVLMTLESACLPIPSEVVMVYGGYLVFAGHLTFLGATAAGTLGNLAGSLIAYWVGFEGAGPLFRWLKHRGTSDHKVQQAERFFHRYGEPSVFVARLLPVVRGFISLPAGVAKMDLRRFVVYTTAGSIPWNMALVWAGLAAGRHWPRVLALLHEANYVLLAIGVLAVVALYVGWRLRRSRRGGRPASETTDAQETPSGASEDR